MVEETRVLLVDDEVNHCKTMALILSRKGYAVTLAYSGWEAIKSMTEKWFDVVFVDMKMPVMNGIETYREMKKIRPGILTVIATAYAADDLIQQALQEGTYEIMYKPLDIDRVTCIIEKARGMRVEGTLWTKLP